MTNKKIMLPVFVAVFALMFVAIAPNVIAESGDNSYDYDKKAHKGHKTVMVEGFVGSIAVPDMSEVEDKKAVYEELKSRVTVKLSDAAVVAENAGLAITKGKMAKVVNENGEKFVVWKLIEKNKDSNSETVTKTIFVVDAADVTNTSIVTKEYDHSMKNERHSGKDYKNTLSDPQEIESKIAKIEQKINDGTLSSEQAESKVQFLYLLRQLQSAISEGNDVQVDSIREQLQELRNQMIDLKKFRQ
ncbi:MAG: hypothetical protein HKM23_03435 [Nitrosopumilus sp.]|nr:hypothetical protein [Nitrosopumilus sp.]